MAHSKRIKIMLSSRCNDRFPADGDQTLSSIREQLKREMKARSFLANRYLKIGLTKMRLLRMACRTVGMPVAGGQGL